MNDRSMDARPLTMPEFEQLLDVFGGNSDRWPADRRAAAEALLAADPLAGRLQAEARALDRTLAEAPRPGAGHVLMLAAEIARAASLDPVATARPLSTGAAVTADLSDGRVVAFPRPAAKTGSQHRQTAPATALPRRQRTGSWQAAAALAASLVLGLAIGTTEYASTAALGIASATGEQGRELRTETEIVLASLQGDGLGAVLFEDQK